MGFFKVTFNVKHPLVMNCDCPLPAALPNVPNVTCFERLGQINKLIFQRAGFVFNASAGTPNPITALASWTPLWIATDDTKTVITPEFEAHVIPEAAPNTRGGGDNETIRGRQEVTGSGPIVATGRFANVSNDIISALQDALECEPDLSVFMVNEFGRIIGRNLVPGTPGDQVTGIPISALFFPDAGNGGHNTDDTSTFRYALDKGWRKDLAIITPTDFNALTQLVNP